MAKIILSTLILTLCAPTFAASFDCAKAGTKVEKLICSNDSISKQDENLAKTYKGALDAATDKEELKKQQIAWLKARNTCADEICLMQSYQNRILELSSQELKKVTTGSVTSKMPATKKPITFQLVDGLERPICQQYIQMLTATKYTEFPTCERKVLPQFPQFKTVDWTEITDKQEMTRVIEERFKINSKLYSLVSAPKSLSIDERRLFLDLIEKGGLKIYIYTVDVNGDGVADKFYRIIEKNLSIKEYELCEDHSVFYINDSKIESEKISKYFDYPYITFNLSGSNELFIFDDKIYVGAWAGKLINNGSNLDIYEVGNNKLCGILVK